MNIETVKRFLSDSPSRYGINKYHWMDGYLCATDGRVLIRYKMDHKPVVEYAEGYPDVNSVLSGLKPGEEISLIDLCKGETVKCEECGGTGRNSVICPECEGDGSSSCPTCGHEKNCERCHGDGHIPGVDICRFCGGSKKTYDNYEINNNHGIAGKYIILLSALPDVRLFIDRNAGDDYNYPAIKYTFDGGDGVIMPIRINKN